jgi:WD40 repeat protein
VPTIFSTHPEDTGMLLSGSADGWIRTWSWDTGATVREWFPGDWSRRMNAVRGFFFTEELIVTSAVNGLLRAWDRQTDEPRFDLRLRTEGILFMEKRGDLLAVVMWISPEDRKNLVELYDISALDQEQSRFVNDFEDLSTTSLVMNMCLGEVSTDKSED